MARGKSGKKSGKLALKLALVAAGVAALGGLIVGLGVIQNLTAVIAAKDAELQQRLQAP